MLQILLGPDREAPADDPLRRARLGWRPGLTEKQVWKRARGTWALNPDTALAQDEAEVISTDGIVRCVVGVLGITKTRTPRRYAIEGKLLEGDPRVGKPTVAPHVSRNPIAYY